MCGREGRRERERGSGRKATRVVEGRKGRGRRYKRQGKETTEGGVYSKGKKEKKNIIVKNL